MSDARRARAECQAALAACVAQTAPVGGSPRRSPSPSTNAATGLTGNEQQASLLHPSVRQDGHTATPSLTPAGSSSHAHRAPMEARAALIAANELLRYRPVDDLYEEWLDRVAELVCAAGGSPTPSHSLPPPQPAMGDRAHGMPPPPRPQDGALAPRSAPPRHDPPRPAPAREERSCQEIPRPREAAPALPAPPRQDRVPPAVAQRGPRQDQAPPQKRAPATTAGCRAFTPELRSVAWPGKFKPDPPPRYDGTADPRSSCSSMS